MRVQEWFAWRSRTRRAVVMPSVVRRYPFCATVLAAWLGGGLLSALISLRVDYTNDTLYAAVHVAAASLALLVFPLVAPRFDALLRRKAAARRHRSARPGHRPPRRAAQLPVPVPAQPAPPRLPQRDEHRPLVGASG